MIEAQAIQISLKENIEEKLYIEVTCMAGEEKATAIISGGHTNFVYLSKNDSVLMDKRSGTSGETEEESVELNLKKSTTLLRHLPSKSSSLFWKPDA